MPSKLIPLESPFSPEIENILANYPQQNGYLLKLFRVFANSKRFLTKGVPNLLDGESPLSIKEREIIILRVTANNNCEYEWGVHVAAFAQHAKLELIQIQDTKSKKINASIWTTREQALFEMIDQLLAKGSLNKDALAVLREYWSEAQQLEICALCGTYQTVSYVANIAEMDNEPFAARFPEE